mgnify:CR=1 FL=1
MNAKKHTPLSLHGLRLLFPPLATLGILFLTEWIARGSLTGETFTQYIFPHVEAYLLAWAMLFLSWLAVDWLTRFAPLATLLSAVLGCAPAAVNFYTLQLRGEPFLPWDLMQVSEAAGVAAAAGIHIQTSMVVSIVIIMLLVVVSFFLYRGRQKLNWKPRAAGFLASAAATCGLLFGVFLQPAVTQAIGIVPDAWMQDRYYRYYGVITSFLTNLTCRTPIETNLSLKDIFFRSKAMYKLWVRDQFTVFSPEIFVRIQQGKISSYPMKGTLDASLPSAVRQLMDDPKEAAEHATIVDLIRNDLSIVADRVSVSRYRYIDKLQTNRGTILQTSSEIQGTLPDNYRENLGHILFKLLPAGSITGAPKKKTMQIISEAETYERGFYTGVMGYFDGSSLDSAVMIRFVEQEGDRMYFKSGGGITCRSEVESEYHEMKQKVYVPIY